MEQNYVTVTLCISDSGYLLKLSGIIAMRPFAAASAATCYWL